MMIKREQKKADFRNRDVRRLFTHICPDLDAMSSVWFFMRFIAKKQLEVKFVPASWGGCDMGPHDVALDIDAGGRGLKGEKVYKGRVHSCFKLLVENYADNKTKEVLKSLVKLIDYSDTYGGTYKTGDSSENSSYQVASFIALSLVMKAFKEFHNSDQLVLSRMLEVFDGIYQMNKKSIEGQKDIMQRTIVVGKTAILSGNNTSSRRVFFKKGFRALVYTDGNNIGVLAGPGLRADNPDVLQVIKDADEVREWFIHSSGFLVARGTRKDPRETGSRVDPYKLATAMEAARKRIEDI